MKNLALCLAGVAALMLSACVSVEFRQPQPAGQPDLDRFPAAWEGAYLSDSDTIRISGGHIRISSPAKKAIPLSQLDSLGEEYVLRDGLLFAPAVNSARGFPYAIEGDTLYAEIVEESEMGLSDSLRLRRYEGRYYVSQASRDGLFACALVEVRGEPAKRLTVWIADPGDEKTLAKLRQFMAIEAVRNGEGATEYYVADPEPAALAKFAKAGGFGAKYLLLRRL